MHANEQALPARTQRFVNWFRKPAQARGQLSGAVGNPKLAAISMTETQDKIG
jgi:hypothetical protein